MADNEEGYYLEDCDDLILVEHPNVMAKTKTGSIMDRDIKGYDYSKYDEYCPVIPTQAAAQVEGSRDKPKNDGGKGK